MTEVKANLKHLRIAPRKVRLLADLVRNMPLKQAELQLGAQAKKAGLPLLKLLKSAESNAKHNFNLSPDDLYIKKITVDTGRTLKRYMARAMGKSATIRKRTSHITVVLDQKQKK